MNETNPIEEQLRSWTPRRPSSGLRSKLFGEIAPEHAQEPIAWNRVVSWLVPATACFLVAFGLIKSEQNASLFQSGTNSSPVFFAMVGSNTVSTPLADQEFQFASASGNMALNVWSKASSLHSSSEPSWAVPDGPALRSLTNHLQ